MGEWSVVPDAPPAKSEWAVVPDEKATEPAPAAAPVPGLWDRFTDRLASGVGRVANFAGRVGSAVGASVGEQAGKLANFAQHPLDELRAEIKNPVPHPERAREALRGLDDLVTLGHGQKIAEALDPSMRARGEQDAQTAGDYRALGQAAGMFTPGAASVITKGAGKLVGAGTAALRPASTIGKLALGTAKGVGSYEASAPAISALSADASGDRMGAAREAATDPLGLLMSGAGGAAAETAPERVAARARKDITTGEQNAGIGKVRKLDKAIGPEDAKLKDLFGRDPKLYKTIATKAHGNPEKAEAAVNEAKTVRNDRLNEIYDEMQAKGHAVTPSDVAIEFDKLTAKAKNAGDLDAMDTIAKERARFLSTYGEEPEITADQMRGLKAGAGKGFEKIVSGQVKRDLWGVYSDAIATKAKSAGVDAKELQNLNRDMSVLIPAEDALKQRATMAKNGRASIGEHAFRAALMGGGLAHGGLSAHGLAEMGAGYIASKVIPPLARRADFALSQTSAPMVGAKAAELEYAAKVAEGMKAGKSLADAVKDAEEE